MMRVGIRMGRSVVGMYVCLRAVGDTGAGTLLEVHGVDRELRFMI